MSITRGISSELVTRFSVEPERPRPNDESRLRLRHSGLGFPLSFGFRHSVGANLMITIHLRSRESNRPPVWPLNLHPVYVVRFTEPEMQRIGVLRTVGISGNNLPRRAAAPVMDCDAEAHR